MRRPPAFAMMVHAQTWPRSPSPFGGGFSQASGEASRGRAEAENLTNDGAISLDQGRKSGV